MIWTKLVQLVFSVHSDPHSPFTKPTTPKVHNHKFSTLLANNHPQNSQFIRAFELTKIKTNLFLYFLKQLIDCLWILLLNHKIKDFFKLNSHFIKVLSQRKKTSSDAQMTLKISFIMLASLKIVANSKEKKILLKSHFKTLLCATLNLICVIFVMRC